MTHDRSSGTPAEVLAFWFEELEPAAWWRKDPALDAAIVGRFGALLAHAARCELYGWRETPRGRLAEVIVLDQFSRNVHRDSAAAFGNDSLALALAQEAVAGGHDAALAPMEKAFLYMPYMHSESLLIHHEAGRLFAATGLDQQIEFEARHREIIERFGRYPHRNALLARASTPAETAFLAQPGSSF